MTRAICPVTSLAVGHGSASMARTGPGGKSFKGGAPGAELPGFALNGAWLGRAQPAPFETTEWASGRGLGLSAFGEAFDLVTRKSE